VTLEDLRIYVGKQGKYTEKFENSEAVGAITDEILSPFPCELQPAGEFQGIYA